MIINNNSKAKDYKAFDIWLSSIMLTGLELIYNWVF